MEISAASVSDYMRNLSVSKVVMTVLAVFMLIGLYDINILDFDIRKDNSDWLQPAKYVYTKEPVAVALPQKHHHRFKRWFVIAPL
jgi:hypothetical protein